MCQAYRADQQQHRAEAASLSHTVTARLTRGLSYINNLTAQIKCQTSVVNLKKNCSQNCTLSN